MDTDAPSLPANAPAETPICALDASNAPISAITEPVAVNPLLANFGDKLKQFTASNAAEAARKRWEVKRAMDAQPQPKNVPTVIPDALQTTLSGKERSKLVRDYKELARISMDNLKTLTDPKDRHQEASTLAKINQALWRYSQVPGEGTLKPTTAKPRDRRMENIGPVG